MSEMRGKETLGQEKEGERRREMPETQNRVKGDRGKKEH